jgi:hypothetical protein
MEACCKDLQSPKAASPIEVTESGMAMLVSDVHLKKAQASIEVTESGMAMLVSDVQ